MRSPKRPPDRVAQGATLVALTLALWLFLSGCGASKQRKLGQSIPRSLVAQARAIGAGPRFHPAVTGTVLGRCRRRLGRRFSVHIEVFAADRVVLLPAGIGVKGPMRLLDGRVVSARCFGSLVTLDPTGVVLVRAESHPRLRDLFREWGQPLTRHDLVGFGGVSGQPVTVYVNGRESKAPPGSMRLNSGSEIVLEIGPHVPPHRSYKFPDGT